MEYYNNDNMGQWHYAKIKENKALSILVPNLEANILHHIAIFKKTVTFSYHRLFRIIPTHQCPIWKTTFCTTSEV